VVTVVASQTKFQDLEETLKQAQGRYYVEVTSNTRGAITMRSRGIGLVEPASSTLESDHIPIPASSVATDTCFIVSHSR